MANIEIAIVALDLASEVFGKVGDNLGNTLGKIATAAAVAAAALGAMVAAGLKESIDAAVEAELALTGLDVVLASTASGAGIFSETVGRLSEVNLLKLQVELQNANKNLADMRDAYGNVKTYTDQETLSIMMQEEKIKSLTAQIERGANGLVIYKDTTQLSRDAMIDLADALQDVTRYSDEEILSAEAMILRFENINSNIFPDAIRLTTDLAASMGIDLTAAARMIGVALDDPAAGIGRLNTQYRLFDETQMKVIKSMAEGGNVAGAQALIIEALTEKIGGAAEAFGNTFAGMIDIAKNRISDFGEAIGGPFREVLKLLIDDLMGFGDSPFIVNIENFFNRLTELLQNDITPLAALGVTFKEFANLAPSFEDIGNAILLFNSALGSGNNPFEALKISIGTLLEMHPDGPLAPILESIQNFINIGESAGWGTAISGLFDEVMTAIDIPGKIQWLVDKIAPALKGTDWSEITNQIVEGISGILYTVFSGLYKVVEEVNWSPMGSAIATAIGEAIAGTFGRTSWDQLAGDIGRGLEGIGTSIVDGIRNGIIIRWENLKSVLSFGFDDVIVFVKRILGIASPSSVFADIGRDIVLGLIGGVGSMWTTFYNYVSGLFRSLLANFSIGNILDGLLGGDSAGVGGTWGGSGTVGGRSTGGSTGGTGTTVNQYFAGATINVGSWGEIAYDCVYPNPFIAATSGQLGGGVVPR